MGGSDRRKWVVCKSGRANDFEEREPKQALQSSHQELEQGSGW